jgi:FMN reductase
MSVISVVVGNPKPRSRTYHAAVSVAEKLTGRPPDVIVDLVDLGSALLEPQSAEVATTVATVQSSSLVVVASPTYKASFTGLLKLFLDRIGTGALADVTAVPLMLGGDMRHSLAPEVFLKPVLTELGASCPVPGLFLPEQDYLGSEALESWLARAVPLVGATMSAMAAMAAEGRTSAL